MEMQKMKAMRIVREQLTRERLYDERFKEQLLLNLAEQIDREMKSNRAFQTTESNLN